MTGKSWLIALALLFPARGSADPPHDDVLVADFEQETYGAWQTTGEAFGPGPARGTLPNQMEVNGFEGQRLVNSFYGGDATTGTLTSPPLRIERRYLNFLLGGGRHPDETCIQLVVGDQVVRTATGPNDRPGGSERLDWRTWDVSPWEGQMATIVIVDRHTGGWGHINVDQIIQSDRRFEAAPAQRELVAEQPLLLLPVQKGAARQRMVIRAGDQIVREFEIELAQEHVDFWVSADIRAWQGKTLKIEVDRLRAGSTALNQLRQGVDLPESETIYHEPQRPQFHFTARRGWHNDPNGLVFLDGEYHLFFQHNPYGWNWGNMHWGHAVSSDLVHWQELPIALYPRKFGDWCYSGSAVVDTENTSGFQSGAAPVIVAAFTSTGRGECIVYSRDHGRTWSEFEGNPVVRHSGRDPRLLWYAPTRRWIMAVYDEYMGTRNIAFYTSPDLKNWEFASRIAGFFECPDLFELPLAGEPEMRKWVLSAADGKYMIGQFDGHAFHPESDKQSLWHGNFYAAQTFSNVPQSRRIQIGWANGITFPQMPFNQQMTVPVELTLRPTAEGPRMFAQPIRELAGLRDRTWMYSGEMWNETTRTYSEVTSELLDVEMTLQIAEPAVVELSLYGVSVVYDTAAARVTCGPVSAPLQTQDDHVALRLLLDRHSLELFGQEGRVALSVGVQPQAHAAALSARARVGTVSVPMIAIHALRSAWNLPGPFPATSVQSK